MGFHREAACTGAAGLVLRRSTGTSLQQMDLSAAEFRRAALEG